jgi:hypothetical protein
MVYFLSPVIHKQRIRNSRNKGENNAKSHHNFVLAISEPVDLKKVRKELNGKTT